MNHNRPYTFTYDNNYVSKYLYYINYIFIIIFLFRDCWFPDSKSSPNSTIHNSYFHLARRYTSFALQIPDVFSGGLPRLLVPWVGSQRTRSETTSSSLHHLHFMPSSCLSSVFVRVQVSHPYTRTDSTVVCMSLIFSFLLRVDYQIFLIW